MPILPTTSTVDYTDVDFDSLRARLYSLISGAFPDWSEQSVASFGNLLVELFAHVGDVLGFYLDARARESRLSQATERQSVVALAKLLGYVPRGASAAQTDLTFSLAQPALARVLVPRGTRVRTLSVATPVEFQLIEDVEIAPGALTGVGTAEHSKTYVEEFAATGYPYQQVRLTQTPFLDRTIVDNVVDTSEYVVADNGVYTRVGTLLTSTATDRHYTLVTDQNERAFLRFGNGTLGQMPTGTIVVRYKTGGGLTGNLEPNTLRRLDGAFVDDNGAAVRLSVTNPERATGGQGRRSTRQIQAEAPLRLRALTRSVSREDFETNARRVPGVARALMLTSNEVPAIGENRGRLYLVPAGAGKPSKAMKEAAHTMVTRTYPSTVTFQVEVIDPAYLTVNVHAVVYPVRGSNLKVLADNIRAALAAYFQITLDPDTERERDNPTINFGFYLAQTSAGRFDNALPLSDLMNAVRDVVGVRKLGDGRNDFLVNNLHQDLPIAAHQFPRLGTVTLINGETKTTLG